MARNSRFWSSPAARLLSALLALALWQAAAWAVGNRLLLAGPVQTLTALCSLVQQAAFWKAVGFTFSRVALGFLTGFLAALLLAVLAARFPAAEVLLRPYMAAVKAVPVASFIVIALLWLSGRRLSIFISFLMVLPVLYTAFLQGIRSADEKLLEMAQVFRMGRWNRLRGIYIPALRPYCRSACRACLGMCWKAGVAAEVIGVCTGSLGGMLYDAKVYLELDSLFALTLAIVLASVLFERGFLHVLAWLTDRIEGC